MNSTIFDPHSRAKVTAFRATSSGICNAPASTINVCPVGLAVSTKSSESGFETSGFVTGVFDSSAVRTPERIAPTGPFHGIFEIERAMLTALIAKMSGSLTPSTDKTFTITCTSFLSSFGNSGRIERSISLPVKTASSVGRPSLFTHLDPLIFPPAYNLST